VVANIQISSRDLYSAVRRVRGAALSTRPECGRTAKAERECPGMASENLGFGYSPACSKNDGSIGRRELKILSPLIGMTVAIAITNFLLVFRDA